MVRRTFLPGQKFFIRLEARVLSTFSQFARRHISGPKIDSQIPRQSRRAESVNGSLVAYHPLWVKGAFISCVGGFLASEVESRSHDVFSGLSIAGDELMSMVCQRYQRLLEGESTLEC